VDMMHTVNPNLAMTNCDLEQDAAEVCCEGLNQSELNQTEYTEPEIYMWDDNDIYESEPIVSSDDSQSAQLSSTSDQSESLSVVTAPSPTALVVTCTTKQVRQQPTIIVTRACHPVSYSPSPVVARVSKAGVLSRIKPAAVTIDGSSRLIFENNAVVVSSSDNSFC